MRNPRFPFKEKKRRDESLGRLKETSACAFRITLNIYEWLLRRLQRYVRTDLGEGGVVFPWAAAATCGGSGAEPPAPRHGATPGLPPPGFQTHQTWTGGFVLVNAPLKSHQVKSGPSYFGAVLRYLSLILSIEMLINRSETFFSAMSLYNTLLYRY